MFSSRFFLFFFDFLKAKDVFLSLWRNQKKRIGILFSILKIAALWLFLVFLAASLRVFFHSQFLSRGRFFICFFRFSVQVFSMHEPFQDSKKIWPQRCAHKRNRCKLTAKIKDYRMRWKGPLVIFCTVLAKLYGIKNYAIAADENESDCECVTRVMQQRDEVNMLLRNRFLATIS